MQTEHVLGQRCLERIKQDVQRLEPCTDSGIYASLIKRCGNAKSLLEGRRVHSQISSSSLHSGDSFLLNLLVEMYGKCNSLDDARHVFDEIPSRNEFSWTIMIAAYAQNGQSSEALHLLQRMDQEGLKPNGSTFVSVIENCTDVAVLRSFHARAAECGLRDSVLDAVLLNSYAGCGSLSDARVVFESMPERTLTSWNAMIGAYVQLGESYEALHLWHETELEGLRQNKITFLNVMAACGTPGSLEKAILIHKRVGKLESDVAVANTLVNMYGKCGSLDMAREVFDRMSRKTVVSWTAMISAYTQNGQHKEALELFKQIDVTIADYVIFVSALDACAASGDLDEGMKIHKAINKRGLSNPVLTNSLMNMYGKCGDFGSAKLLFQASNQLSVVSWNTLIAAYAHTGHAYEAIETFRKLDLEGVRPDKITFTSVLDAFSATGALSDGRAIHKRISSYGYNESDTAVCSSLLNMYVKCGSMDDAVRLFNKMMYPSQVSWTSVIAGYAQHGHSEEALSMYQRMDLEGAKPNKVTFLGILIACTHAGLVEDGVHYFMSMVSDHGIEATGEHYGCVIDILGKAGWLDEGEKLIKTMPFEPCAVVWTSLLGACTEHRDVNRAERALKKVIEKEPSDAGPYVLLSNMYAAR